MDEEPFRHTFTGVVFCKHHQCPSDPDHRQKIYRSKQNIEILHMTNTKWYKWIHRNEIVYKRQPAVYFIALSDKDISNEDFAIIEDIIYIGMTISVSGLKGRLDQFEFAMRGKNGIHGGAERVRFKHTNPDDFFNKAYISAKIFEISPSKNTPDDWRIKGDCVGHEYKSFAEYLEKYHRLPEFNDQKRSKKG